VHLALGDRERAFECLEKARAERSLGLTFLKVDANLDDLRPDPRFTSLLARVGLK
jgi:hypothetical protein